MQNRTKLQIVGVAGLALALSATALVSTGCYEYSTYPKVETAKGMNEDPNNPNAEAAMVAALQYVATRYPPNAPAFAPKSSTEAGQSKAYYPLAVCLPTGMRKSYYERIATEVGDQVVPLTGEVWNNGSMPVFAVSRVWMRFHTSTVDVLRPMPELGLGPDGKPVYQKVTVKLEGGLEPWRVIFARAWDPGIEATPEPYFLPEVERYDQFKFSQLSPEDQAKWVRTSKAEVLTAPQPKPMPKPVETTPVETTSAPENTTGIADPN